MLQCTHETNGATFRMKATALLLQFSLKKKKMLSLVCKCRTIYEDLRLLLAETSPQTTHCGIGFAASLIHVQENYSVHQGYIY